MIEVLGSRRFYRGVVIFLVVEALWIAFSAAYPMAFDEEFHLGVIRIYSHQWLPFLSGQPDGANAYGALAVDPSYLYHYLMSFPYRFIATLTDNLMVQVVVLRLINVAMMVSGVVLFGKVLRRAGLSAALTNTAILLFALVPAVVLLAGQINYDNLVFLLLAWVCWLVLDITQAVRSGKIQLKILAVLAMVLLLASLVKYAFLTIAVAVVAYIGGLLVMHFRTRGQVFWRAVRTDFRALSGAVRLALLVGLIVCSGLFAQRYVANVLRHHDPVPSCDVVLDIEDCMEYGPWARNYRYAADKPVVSTNPLAYTWLWLQGLHYRLFFMITGPPSYSNYPPPVLPAAMAVVIVIFGLASLLFYWRRIFSGRPFLVFVLLMAAIYTAILWATQNYPQYLQTGRPVAINGRYLVPLILPLVAVLGTGLGVAIRRWPTAKTWVAVGAIVLFLQGGGVFGFILRSDASWYWPNTAVKNVNQTAQHLLAPVMIVGPKGY